VVAHLALNAEGLARRADQSDRGQADEHVPVRRGAGRGHRRPGRRRRAELRDRFLAGTTLVVDAIERMPDELWTETFERTPGGRVIRYAAVPGMRLREVEIHHVDLDAGFAPRGWSDAFASHLIGAMVKRAPSDTSFRVLATDLASTWVIGGDPGESGTTVSGPAGDLAWWLTGRPPAASLTSSTGDLPPRESLVR
jgi:maleylpyruvate isomerase